MIKLNNRVKKLEKNKKITKSIELNVISWH